MKYSYEELSPEQFERLVIHICQKLLGISVQGFAVGRMAAETPNLLEQQSYTPVEAPLGRASPLSKQSILMVIIGIFPKKIFMPQTVIIR